MIQHQQMKVHNYGNHINICTYLRAFVYTQVFNSKSHMEWKFQITQIIDMVWRLFTVTNISSELYPSGWVTVQIIYYNDNKR